MFFNSKSKTFIPNAVSFPAQQTQNPVDLCETKVKNICSLEPSEINLSLRRITLNLSLVDVFFGLVSQRGSSPINVLQHDF